MDSTSKIIAALSEAGYTESVGTESIASFPADVNPPSIGDIVRRVLEESK